MKLNPLSVLIARVELQPNPLTSPQSYAQFEALKGVTQAQLEYALLFCSDYEAVLARLGYEDVEKWENLEFSEQVFTVAAAALSFKNLGWLNW